MGSTLAIVVPVKGREAYLQEFEKRVPNYLREVNQIEDFVIVSAEQTDDGVFSASTAKNVGASFALSEFEVGAFVFNDVDTIPQKNVDYAFRDQISICFMNFGSCKVSEEAFRATNGYNPTIFGWGFEDVEFYDRLEIFGFDCERWDRTREAEEAVVLDLELRNETPVEDLAHSRWYWKRDDDIGPKFVSPSWELEHYEKTWFSEEHKKRNSQFANSIYNMPMRDRGTYYEQHGCSSMVTTPVDVKQEAKRIFRVRYDSRVVYPRKDT